MILEKIKTTQYKRDSQYSKPGDVYINLHQHLQAEVNLSIWIPSYRLSLSSWMDYFRSVNTRIDQLFGEFTNTRMTNQFLHWNFVPFVLSDSTSFCQQLYKYLHIVLTNLFKLICITVPFDRQTLLCHCIKRKQNYNSVSLLGYM